MNQHYNAVCAFLYREARFLDDREWESWLALYAPDAEYWMPAWDDDDQLTNDPHGQISLIYYPNRNGLEDRVFVVGGEEFADGGEELAGLDEVAGGGVGWREFEFGEFFAPDAVGVFADAFVPGAFEAVEDAGGVSLVHAFDADG